jgi:hypothetical protein
MHEYKGCSDEALSVAADLSLGPTINPTASVIHAQIFDLEADLRNVDFRLQNFYHQRTLICSLLAEAKDRLPYMAL